MANRYGEFVFWFVVPKSQRLKRANGVVWRGDRAMFLRLRTRMWRAYLLAATLVVALSIGGWAGGLQLTGNIHTIKLNEAYRAAQLNGSSLAGVLQKYGIKTAVNLRESTSAYGGMITNSRSPPRKMRVTSISIWGRGANLTPQHCNGCVMCFERQSDQCSSIVTADQTALGSRLACLLSSSRNCLQKLRPASFPFGMGIFPG